MSGILLACSGLGTVVRGYERATAEIAAHLRAEIELTVARGGGPWIAPDKGVRLPCVPRFGRFAKRAMSSPEAAYVLEQRSFAIPAFALARGRGADVVHLHDPALTNALWHLRRRFGGNLALVFTNGAPLTPEHLGKPDVVHCVTPVGYAEALAGGVPAHRLAMVPYGLDPVRAVATPQRAVGALRLVGVGALNATHKGLDRAIRATAALPDAHLTFLGQADAETPPLRELARTLLPGRHELGSVEPAEVLPRLSTADAFILPTQQEGFCLAALEALGAGLPCVVSDLPVLRWLIGPAGIYVGRDDGPGWVEALRSLTPARLAALAVQARLRASAFGWNRLIPEYLRMYAQARAVREGRAPNTITSTIAEI